MGQAALPKRLVVLTLTVGMLICADGYGQGRADWMPQAKWGIMNHYLADWMGRREGIQMDVDQWNRLVDGFDVEGLADQVQSTGAGYYIITIGQNSGYYLAPNPTYDRLTGVFPSHCSRRDLVADLSAALGKRGIRLIVYLPSGAPSRDRAACDALQWQGGEAGRQAAFQLKWESVIRDWSLRWGQRISGWWFDGCYWPNTMYRSAESPNFDSFAAAARAGNPDGVVAFNPGVVDRIISVTPFEDFSAGEINAPDRLMVRRSRRGKIDGAQVHVLSFLGEKWGMGQPRFTAEQAVTWSLQVRRYDGVITWDVPIQSNGLMASVFMDQLKIIGQALGTRGGTQPPVACEPVPSASQLAWQEDELTMFVHFGMNTFTGRSTGLGSENPSQFNPTDLDCRQWARVARETGFKGILLTAKHHDGFCLWPTKTTEHSVQNSPWRNGQGDVVRALSDACREFGIKLGIYCSPWDRSQPIYDTDKAAYSRFYREQLTELLTNYGDVYEMWFDGNKARMADWAEIIRLVRTLQPGAVIKQGPRVEPITEDIRWVGNEAALAPLTCWSVYPPPGQEAADRIWFPVECDIPMIGDWFWNDKPPLELARLLDLYYTSVGRNSILLLNVAPNKKGRLSDDSVRRLREFRSALDDIFGTDLAAHHAATASQVRGNDPLYGPDQALDGDKTTYWATDDHVTVASLEVDLGEEKEFNVVRMEEMISLGQRVQRYRVDVMDRAGHWKPISQGTTIGYRKLDRFSKVAASKVRLCIVAARACPAIKSFGVHMDTISPPENFEPANANAERIPKR